MSDLEMALEKIECDIKGLGAETKKYEPGLKLAAARIRQCILRLQLESIERHIEEISR